MNKLKNGLRRVEPGRKAMIVCVALLIALKLGLCSFQMMLASPNLSPIDDSLMVRAASSIVAGEWLGPYDCLTLGKHMGFAIWLALLNKLGINFLLGGQILFAAACVVALFALKPLFRTNLARLFLFACVLYTPASWAEHTLRVYRDNIYPALVLMGLTALTGAFLRWRERPLKALPYYIIAGLALGAAWLTHEDNMLLIPFLACGTLVFVLFLLLCKEGTQKIAKLAMLLIPIACFASLPLAYSAMNQAHYGRFIVSDFTSKEFNDAMGALTRVKQKENQPFLILPRETREQIYAVSPLFAKLGEQLETDDIYNSYGSVSAKEISSGGFHWAVRVAAQRTGIYENAKTAEQFYTALAAEVNKACDDGLLPAGKRRSGTLAPFDASYIAPTLREFGKSVKAMVLFEQTKPTTDLSIATPEQTAYWEDFMHCRSTIAAEENTSVAYYAPLQRIANLGLQTITMVWRVIVWPMMAATLWFLISYCKKLVAGAKKRAAPKDLMGCILMVGILLTALLRMAAISYLTAMSFGIPTYLMYLSAACPLLTLFAGFGTARWFEDWCADAAA